MHHRTFQDRWEDTMRRKITAFINSLRPDDLAGIGHTEKTQYQGRGRSLRKGGSPPKDYLAVEALIDLREALSRSNIYEALPHYYWLKRVLNR